MVAGGGRWVDVEVFAQHSSEKADSAIEKARNRDEPFERNGNTSKKSRHQRFRAAERWDNRMRTHENMKRDLPLLSPMWGGYWMAYIACQWDVHILSSSRMAERRSQERRQPIVISRRDNDMLRIALTSSNMCVHGPRARPGVRDLRACQCWKGRDDAKSECIYVAEKDCSTTVMLTRTWERSRSRRRPRWSALTVSFGARDTTPPTQSVPYGEVQQSLALSCPQKKLCRRKQARTRLGHLENGTRRGRQNTPQRQDNIPKACSM